jgi:hypothetical protein
LEKVMSHKSSMHVGRESDDRVLPTKRPNNDGKPSAEGAEGRRSANENSGQATASQTQSWGNALSGLHRVREAAKKDINYHAVPGNLTSLKRFRLEVSKRWLRALRRHGQKHPVTWALLGPLIERWLQYPRFFIRILICVATPNICDRSRMQECCTCGSVRGALGNQRPYRDIEELKMKNQKPKNKKREKMKEKA